MRDDKLASHHEKWFRFDVEKALYGTPGFWKVFLSMEGTMQDDFVRFVKQHRVAKIGFIDWRAAEASDDSLDRGHPSS